MITRTPPAAAIYLKNAHLLDPARRLDGAGELLAENGRMVAVGKPGELAARAAALSAEIIDAGGAYVAPGFVDLNCEIPDPGAEGTENFASGSAAAAAGGFTTLLVQPGTRPAHDTPFLTDTVLRRAADRSCVRIVPLGALTVNREGKKLAELGSMARAGARAVGDGHAGADAYLLRKALEYTQAFRVPVFSFPEDRALAADGVMQEGWNSNRLGLRGVPNAAEEIAVARDLILARHTGGRLHLAPLSVRGSLELLRQAKAAGLAVTAETHPAYFSLNCHAITSYDANYKVSPPLRDPEDVEAVIAALADGTLDAISSGHRPRPAAAKAQSFEAAAPGMIALESAFLLSLALAEQKRVSLGRLVELLSTGPARVLGLEAEVGTLGPGAHADFVLFRTAGQTKFTEGSLRSASRNTPFLGQTFAGGLLRTYVGGRLVHENKELTP